MNFLLYRSFKIATGIIYFASVFFIVFLAPERREMPVQIAKRLRLIPFEDAVHFILAFQTFRANQIHEFFLNFIGNIFLFFPMPIFLYFVWKIRNLNTLTIAAFICSLLTESIQLLTGVGVADITDIILNTFGAAIAVLILSLIKETEWAKKL